MIRRGARPSSHYLVVANAVVCDRRLTFAATGLLVHLLSKPDHWEVSASALAREAKEGRDKIYKLINELIETGYCRRAIVRDGSGKITRTDYEIFDSPVDPESPEETPVNPLPEKPDTAKPDTDLPDTAKPTQESKEDKKVTNSESNQFNTPSAKLCGFDFSSWSTRPSEKVLKDWIKVRNAHKAPLTQTTIDRLAVHINGAAQHGYTAGDCLGLAVEKGWRGFKLEWLLREENSQQQGHGSGYQRPQPQGRADGNARTRDIGAAEVATDMNW